MRVSIISFVLIIVFGHLYGQNPCGREYSITFEDSICMERLIIDSVSDPDNIWEVGQPQKTNFTSAKSPSNVLVTGRNKPYPINDTSSFILYHVIPEDYTGAHTGTSLIGFYQANTDSLNDYTKISFSPDNGLTWVDLATDTIYNSDSTSKWYIDHLNSFTGNSKGWQYFSIDMPGVNAGPSFGYQDGDTIQYRFTFISDSIIDSLDGLMIDDIQFGDSYESVEELSTNQIKVKVTPNPATDKVTFQIDGQSGSLFALTIYDGKGRRSQKLDNVPPGNLAVRIGDLTKGIYFYRLENLESFHSTSGKFIVLE